jgi:hypothetical protein
VNSQDQVQILGIPIKQLVPSGVVEKHGHQIPFGTAVSGERKAAEPRFDLNGSHTTEFILAPAPNYPPV